MKRRFRMGDRVVIAVPCKQIRADKTVVDFKGRLGTVTGVNPNGKTVDVLPDNVEDAGIAGGGGSFFFGSEEVEHADPVVRLAELAE